ncbi:hypothetical protein ABZY45_19860 [Streptomyces sp. NPDC006516]|uniref:hypothetical protein n=1 Tax=Streptomyces sp. NPDC006516 TaxID=3154309 RepID=UPI0033A9D584
MTDGSGADRIDLNVEDAPWLQALVSRVYVAQQNDDQDEADRLLAYARSEGSAPLSRLAEQLLEGLASRAGTESKGKRM